MITCGSCSRRDPPPWLTFAPDLIRTRRCEPALPGIVSAVCAFHSLPFASDSWRAFSA